MCALILTFTSSPDGFYTLFINLLCSDINRCQESTSSPGVSNSISEGIIEEEEDEEAEEESNKKRMKEDDQEVLFVSLLFQHLWF